MPETGKTSEQKKAEADVESFRENLGPFVVAAETTRMPMAFTDAKALNHPIIFANDSFLKLTGYGRDDLLGMPFDVLVEGGVDTDTLTQVRTAFQNDSHTDPDIHYRRRDGSEFWASVFISPVRDKGGDVVQHFVSVVDLTKFRLERTQSRMLIDELNHRVKNTLSTVQSIASQALRSSTDPEQIRESIESRLFALSRSHDLLTREDWIGAGLHDLVKDALEPFDVTGGRSARLIVTGENIRMSPKATLALGIAFHELATNAVKYGAFSNDAGSIQIVWSVKPMRDGDRLILHWREKDGPPVIPPSRKGFGSQVIERGLAHELGGTVQLDHPPEGVVCTINIPVPRGARNG